MNRTKLLTLVASTAIGGLLLAYGLNATAKADAEKPAQEETKPYSGEDYVMVKYNDTEIRRSEFDTLWGMAFAGTPNGETPPNFDAFPDAQKIELLKNMVRERLVLEKAYAENIDKTDDVKMRLDNAKRQIVAQVYLNSIAKKLVKDKEIREQYDIATEKLTGRKEARARHILVETKEEAEEIYTQVKEGADFEAIAQKKSKDSGSGAKGGDLGYFTKEAMIPAFSEVVFEKLKKGEISEPVETEFGWHVIKLEDKRDVSPPPYESVEAELRKSLEDRAIGNYIKEIIDGKDMSFYAPDGDELKADKQASAQ